MPALPTPVIEAVAAIAYSASPQDVPLDGSNSTPSDTGTIISAYLWTLFDAPTGSAAYIQNPTSATPVLKDVTVGCYGIHLKVTDDDGKVSHAYWYPTQRNTAPYDFVGPAPSAIATVTMLTQYAGLAKVNQGARSWFPLEGGYWDLVDALDAVHAGVLSGDGYYDYIYEKTANHGVVVDGVKNKDGNVYVDRVFPTSGTPGDGVMVDETLIEGTEVKATRLWSGVGVARLNVEATDGEVMITSTAEATLSGGTYANVSSGGNLDVQADGVLSLDPGEGYIAAKTDFRTNAITPIATNSGVTITKRGTSDYDVKFAKAEAAEVNSVLDANLKLTRVATLASNAATVELKNGVVEISGGAGVGWDLATSYIKPRADNSGLVVQGRGTHTADLFLDEMRSDTVGGALNINDVPHKSGRVDGIDVSRLGPEIRATDETLTNTTAAVQAYTTKITVTGGLQVGEVQEIEAAVFVNAMPDGGAVTVIVRVDSNAVLTGSYTLTADTGFIMRGELHVVSAGVYRLYGSVTCTDDNSVTPMRAVDLGGVGSTYDITAYVQFGATGGANAATLELLSSRIRPAYVAP